MSDQAFPRRLAAEFAGLLAAELTGSAAAKVEPGTDDGANPGILLSFKFSGPHNGSLVVWVGTDAAMAAPRAQGDDTPESVERAVVDAGRRAAIKVGLQPEFANVNVTAPAGAPGWPPSGATHFSLTLPDGSSGSVAVAAVLTQGNDGRSAGNLDLVLDVELPLVVRFGRTILSLKALASLGPGSVVDMGRSPDDPVELLVSDKVVAYGEVVIVDGSYGLRITEVLSSANRMRAGESR
jgi:flagellar motor switch protein FliN